MEIENKSGIRICTGKFNKVLLKAPTDYWMQDNETILKETNGMGPDSFWVNWIPEKLRNQVLLLDVSEAAYIHDWMYSVEHEGWSKADHMLYKHLADEIFLYNLFSIIESNYDKELLNVKYFKRIQKWFIKKRYLARKEEAKKLYYLVDHYGLVAFLADKEFFVGTGLTPSIRGAAYKNISPTAFYVDDFEEEQNEK